MAADEEEEEIAFEYESDEEDAFHYFHPSAYSSASPSNGEQQAHEKNRQLAIDEESILLENSFYEAQDLQLNHPLQAIKLYEEVVEKEEKKEERRREKEEEHDQDGSAKEKKSSNAPAEIVWRFKALLNLVLIHLRLGDFKAAVCAYRRLLPLLERVTRNEASNAINSVLESAVSSSDRSVFDESSSSSSLSHSETPRPSSSSSSSSAACVVKERRGEEEGEAKREEKRREEQEKKEEEEGEKKAMENLEIIFHLTLEALKQQTHVTRLWLRTCSRMIKLYIHQGNFDKAERVLADVHREWQRNEKKSLPSNSLLSSSSSSSSSSAFPSYRQESVFSPPRTFNDDDFQGGQLLEFYSLEMSLCVARGKDFNRLKCLYTEARKLLRQGVVAEPRNAGVIQEIGGRIAMKEKRWKSAYIRFNEAFQNYQTVGRVKEAKKMIECVVLSSLLARSQINPLHTREAKALQDEPGVYEMQSLRKAFEEKNTRTACNLLTSPKYGLSTDPYISLFIPDLLRCLRLHALPSILAPYSRVSLHCLQEELQTDSREEVISLLHEAISTCRIRGVIDDVQGVFVHYRRETRSSSSLVSSRSSSSSSSLLTSRGPVSQEKKRENRMIKNSEKRGEEPIHDDEDNEKEEEESIPREESVLKDWVDSLSSLTRNLSLASPFGGGSTVSTMSTVSPMSTMKSTMSTLSSSSSPSLGTVKQTKITSQTDTSMA